MPESFNIARSRPLLQNAEFSKLFIEELGWDTSHQKLTLGVGGEHFELHAIAQKRGFTAWSCECPNGKFPDHATRLKLDRKLAETSFEHLVVFITADRSRQSWMWVRREKGQPIAARTHEYHRSQPGDALLQKLEPLYVSLEEEERGDLSTVAMAGRARAAFDIERVTKAFYRDFDAQRKAFLKLIKGIGDVADREWYASVMLNRLMFVYFIQRKGFLDGDRDYLRNRLDACKKEKGKDQFHAFYGFLINCLFREGFGKRRKDRAKDLEKLIGNIPYLNGGLFDVHELEKPERYGKEIQIPDKAFEAIFVFFEKWDWQLDPARTVKKAGDKEQINPDVLGFIFERYINDQAKMGAYYTKEDITDYIGKNAVIPFLFDAAKKKCAIAFEGSAPVWDLLRENPDRYIYPAVRHGAELKLPKEIAAGLDPQKPDLIERRKPWNKTAPSEFGLPTEIWRETVARRQRCEEVRVKLAAGEVRDINDLITLNLDIRQFAQDVITRCEGPDLLRAIWSVLTNISVLDPTCGSGAFLFAALNILELLYEACLDRMAAFLEDEAARHDRTRLKTTKHGYPLLPNKKFEDFSLLLEQVAEHPNRSYFVFKRIILKNLYGVDLMKEAVEICKLRLFLKLASQIEPDETKDNLGIEPLPDIDFNIRAGNTLVGYATKGELESVGNSDLILKGQVKEVIEAAEDAAKLYDCFLKCQVEGDQNPGEFKRKLRDKFEHARRKCDHFLAEIYFGGKSKPKEFDDWKKSHQPFHWFVEFYGIFVRGGFDVIIGNPPYVVNTPEKVGYGILDSLYTTYSSKNLYAFVFERSLQLADRNAAVAMIVQLTALSAEKMSSLQDLLLRRGALLTSAFPRRPESIFDGVEMPVSILISRSSPPTLHTTRVNRFYTEERPSALAAMVFAQHDIRLHGHRIAKIGSPIGVGIYRKMESQKRVLGSLTSCATKHALYYQEACRYWLKACVGLPYFRRNGESISPPHGRTLYFRDAAACAFAGCLVNSTLFYWFYSAFSDCEHINDALIRNFRIPPESKASDWIALERRLAENQKRYARRKSILTKQGHKIEYDEMDAPHSKPIIDEIDTVLAQHYGFTPEELDFIINYDIKYRLGRGAGDEDE
jgi:hypothetical protein